MRIKNTPLVSLSTLPRGTLVTADGEVGIVGTPVVGPRDFTHIATGFQSSLSSDAMVTPHRYAELTLGPPTASVPDWFTEAMGHLMAGKKISVIQLFRENFEKAQGFQAGLRETKDFVELLAQYLGVRKA